MHRSIMIKKLFFLNLVFVPIFSMQFYRPRWCNKTLGALQQELQNPVNYLQDQDILNEKKAYVEAYFKECNQLMQELKELRVQTCNWIITTHDPREEGKSPWKAILLVKESGAYTPDEIDELRRKIGAAYQHYEIWSKMGPI